MKKIVFVILHYNAIKDTLECIDSIRKTHIGKSYYIVVIDNNSPNNSGQVLFDKFKDDNDIKVILNSKNLGFARGNNIGFKYAKYKLNADFIVLLNNDTLILQDNFYDLVCNEYNLTKFALLGPVIKSPHNFNNWNPGPKKERSIVFYVYVLLRCVVYYFFNIIGLEKYIEKIKIKLFGKLKEGNGSYCLKRVEDVQLHGCFWIFSKKFIDVYDGLCDKTFLYMEEEILFHRLKKFNLKSVYTPYIHIYHKEDVSTNSLNLTDSQKLRLKHKYSFYSCLVYLKERLF